MRLALAAVLTTGLIVISTGCADKLAGRVAVSGNLKLKGAPIKDGALVMFEPLDGQDTGANATTKGGAYSIPREAGLKQGRYLVRVTAGDGVTAVNPLDPGGPGPGGPGPGGTNIVSKDLVPADWNVASKHEVTVKGDGPNKFDFEIP